MITINVNGVDETLDDSVLYIDHRRAVRLAHFPKYKEWYYVSVELPPKRGLYVQLFPDQMVNAVDGMGVYVEARDPYKKWWEFWKS